MQHSRATIDISTNFDPGELKDKKMTRKLRLNQMINASSKGQRTVKPSIEIEEIAHQYHNLRKEFNQVSEENSRMKARLKQMQSSSKTSENQLLRLNQELLRLKHDQRLSTQ